MSKLQITSQLIVTKTTVIQAVKRFAGDLLVCSKRTRQEELKLFYNGDQKSNADCSWNQEEAAKNPPRFSPRSRLNEVISGHKA